MHTLIYLLSYLNCLTGPGVPQLRGVCAWADVNENGPVDLRDVAIIQNDAGCVIQRSTIRPERLIVDECGIGI